MTTTNDDIQNKEKLETIHQKELYDLGARRMESEDFADTWCHLDLKPVKGYENKIYIFNP